MPTPAMLDITFGGLESREIPERVPFSQAIVASDCLLDQDQIEGRSGYRAVTASAIATTEVPQHSDRFRPSATCATNVEVTGGKVYVVSDPTTLTASDGAATLLGGGLTFGATAKISGAQLNASYYIGTDESGVAMRRVNDNGSCSFSLESLLAIPQGAKPTASQSGALTWTVFSGLTQSQSNCVSQDNSKTSFTQMDSAWRGFVKTDNTGDNPDPGAYTRYKLGANFDATGFNWLAVAVSPHDEGGSAGNRRLGVYVAVDVAGSPGAYTKVGEIFDVPPVADSPNLVFCNLIGMDSAVRSAIRYIKIQVDGQSGGSFITYGYMFLPSPQLAPTQTYYVDFLDTSTLQHSMLTEGLVVTTTDAVLATYPDSRMGNDVAHSDGAQLKPLGSDNLRVWNVQFGKPTPSLQDIGALVTISGTTSAFGAGTVTVRLWKDTPNGRRLVTTQAGVSQSSSYTLVDPGGTAVLQNELYKAGGVPPRTNALASYAGRLIAGYQNTLSVSSFTPPGTTTNPFPQFPAIAIEDADGWQVDLQSKAEQILNITAGDVVYILTNYGLRVLTDVSAPLFSAPSLFYVYNRGICGRKAAIWCEDRLFWCANDGIYSALGRTKPVELSVQIRTYIQDTFLPGAAVTMGYQNRQLFVFNGAKGLMYNFVTQQWVSFTLADTVSMMSSWTETISTGTVGDNMWALLSNNKIGRFQDTVFRDLQSGTTTTTGSAIPDWQYSTGFDVDPQVAKVARFYADVSTNRIKLTLSTSMDEFPERIQFLEPGEYVREFGPELCAYKFRVKLTGANTAKLRRLMWGKEAVDVVAP